MVFTFLQDIIAISLFLFYPELICDHEILHKIKYVTKTFFYDNEQPSKTPD